MGFLHQLRERAGIHLQPVVRGQRGAEHRQQDRADHAVVAVDGDGTNGNLTLDFAVAKDTDGDKIPDVIDIDENVVVSPTELTADVTGETFQWYDCSTGAAIAGANSNIYIPAVTGNYKCLINKGVCSVTTDCYFFEVPGCSTPSGLSAINITTSSAKIIWDNIPDATKYQVQYRPTGTIAWYSVNATTNSKTISSLLSGISYDYRVKTICGALSSPYTPILTFTTL